MMDYPDLKPCPFCGTAPALHQVNQLYPAEVLANGKHYPPGMVDIGYYIRCDECGIEMSAEYQSEAVEQWNQRKDTKTLGLLRQLFDETHGYIEGKSDDHDALLDEVRAVLKTPEDEETDA